MVVFKVVRNSEFFGKCVTRYSSFALKLAFFLQANIVDSVSSCAVFNELETIEHHGDVALIGYCELDVKV